MTQETSESFLFPNGIPELSEEQMRAALAIKNHSLASRAMVTRAAPTPEQVQMDWEGAVYEVTLSREERDRYNA